MKENDFKPQFNTAAEVLKSLLEEQKGGAVADNFLRWKLWLNWSDIVGATTAENCEPISYQKGLLWLWVKNSVWMQHMQFMSETIKASVNKNYKSGFVQEIKFTLDRKDVPFRTDYVFREAVKKFVK